MAETLKEYVVQPGSLVADDDGQKGEGETVKLTADQAKPLLKLNLIK